ncbi:hypothetical protein LOK49_LG01G01010 [Camellia lanceoleosa]|uniref:Uncharacterized protein n=1 Tax=Camellia lanceoleosa TaxID=1840588 RepID=A0ACC0IXZ0_9ERIC|nr:hypothetical protein LOK49_LG01G01010 [Camellia lanceoleosa]
MRSVNLAITNWIVELQAMLNHSIKTPSPLFSYGVSNVGLWKVQLYCPVIAMDVEKSTNPSPDERLWFSLNYHQLEGVIQLNYKVIVREKWVDVMFVLSSLDRRSVMKSSMKGYWRWGCLLSHMSGTLTFDAMAIDLLLLYLCSDDFCYFEDIDWLIHSLSRMLYI